jgi:hypothetical protein
MTPRQLWVKELREGGHTQGRGALLHKGRFCCLGVACLVYERETGNSLPRNNEGEFLAASLIGQYQVVSEWLGLEHKSGLFTRDGTLPTSLAAINDRGKSFAEIADIIESEPEGLFI